MTALRLSLTFLLLFLSTPSWAVNYCEDADVIACYTFDEASGDAIDQSSNGNDMANSNVTQNQSGQFGQAYLYASASGSITKDTTISGSSGVENGNVTVIAYINRTSNGSFFSNGSFDTVFFRTQTGAVFHALKSNVDQFYTGTTTFSNSTWTNGAFTADNSSPKNLKIYVNGTLDATGTVTTTTSFTNSTELFIGAEDDGEASDYNGLVDEVAWFNRVLNSTEINDIKDNGLVGAEAASRRRITSFF